MPTVFYEKVEHKAAIKAFEVKTEHQADIFVYLCKADYEAKEDFLWFLTPNAYKTKTTICWVTQDYKADLKIYFVHEKYKAQWAKPHRLQKRL